jgi:hypothetical protein
MYRLITSYVQALPKYLFHTSFFLCKLRDTKRLTCRTNSSMHVCISRVTLLDEEVSFHINVNVVSSLALEISSAREQPGGFSSWLSSQDKY